MRIISSWRAFLERILQFPDRLICQGLGFVRLLIGFFMGTIVVTLTLA